MCGFGSCREAGTLFFTTSSRAPFRSITSGRPAPTPSTQRRKMGCRMGRQKETVLFRHNDVRHLDDTLRDLRAGRAGSTSTTPPASPTPSSSAAVGEATAASPFNIFVAVESVYSMDGDLAPLTEILRVSGAHGALVIVDEAHA